MVYYSVHSISLLFPLVVCVATIEADMSVIDTVAVIGFAAAKATRVERSNIRIGIFLRIEGYDGDSGHLARAVDNATITNCSFCAKFYDAVRTFVDITAYALFGL